MDLDSLMLSLPENFYFNMILYESDGYSYCSFLLRFPLTFIQRWSISYIHSTRGYKIYFEDLIKPKKTCILRMNVYATDLIENELGESGRKMIDEVQICVNEYLRGMFCKDYK